MKLNTKIKSIDLISSKDKIQFDNEGTFPINFGNNFIDENEQIKFQSEIELIEDGVTQENPFIPQKRSREFEILYESLIVNYSSLNRDNIEYQRPAILYVLPNNIGNLFGTVEQLMDWKKRVGYDVQFVSSSNVVNNRNNLKNYILHF